MPRKPFQCSSDPYHITNRCINRDWFEMPLPRVWEIFQQELFFLYHAFEIEIIAFVLMNNHFHLIARSPKLNMSEGIGYFQVRVANRIVKSQKRINHLWAHRFKRTRLSRFNYFQNTHKYVYQNPMRAGMSRSVLDYPFSTLPGLLGRAHLIVPTLDCFLMDGDIEATLNWLNNPINTQAESDLKVALSRTEFKLPLRTKKRNPLEDELV